jgi:uncharacterized alkaline shock family protein YloU
MASTETSSAPKKAAKAPTKVPTKARAEEPVTILSNQGKNEVGHTAIENHVVAKIAGLAVREVKGVHALVPFGTSQSLAKAARSIQGKEYRDLGVHAEVGKTEAAVDCRIIADYGVSIPEIASTIRDNVTDRIGEMTGLKVTEVNIEVVDLYFEEDVARPQPTPEAHPRVR